MNTDSVYKDRIGIRLTEKLIYALEHNLLSNADISYLSSYIRLELAKAHDSEAVFTFVLQLAKDWPIFADMVAQPANPLPQETQEQQRVAHHHVRQLSHHGKEIHAHA